MQETKEPGTTERSVKEKLAFHEESIMEESKIERPESSTEAFENNQQKLSETVSADKGKDEPLEDTVIKERIIIPPRKKGEKSKFHGKTIKAHKKEDPLFNMKNLLFVAAVMAIFGIFLFVVNYFSLKKPMTKKLSIFLILPAIFLLQFHRAAPPIK